MANNIAKTDILQIFGLILSIGKSEHYSISFDYDTEFNEFDLYLWFCENSESVDFERHLSSRNNTYSDILHYLKMWTKLIVEDRGEPIDDNRNRLIR